MNALKFKRIIYLISATVVITVAAQVYNNIEHYKVNKQRFINDVQLALDSGVENYYADRAKNDIVIYASEEGMDTLDFSFKSGFGTFKTKLDSSFSIQTTFSADSGEWHSKSGISRGGVKGLSIINYSDSTSVKPRMIMPKDVKHIEVRNDVFIADSSNNFKSFAKKIMLSLANNSVELDSIKPYVQEELQRKSINIDFSLNHFLPDEKVPANSTADTRYSLASFSKSTFLPRNQKLEITYENASLAILKRGAFDLAISLLITLSVIGSLLYLYRIISEQKALAEIKNDLISNITHEFKTPIATISTAIEGIAVFNQENDPKKTSKYLDISSGQLKKLNTMVEKLLETATLDSDELEIALEETEAVQFTQALVERYQVLKEDKALSLVTKLKEKWLNVDAFHMENAISNLIDNALKYGGDVITVRLKEAGESTIWEVEDNGGKIDKAQKSRIFEKFYRIPTGNLHNVKGFGIGLYYTKTLVEKHGGTIDLTTAPNLTRFTISIPNGNA